MIFFLLYSKVVAPGELDSIISGPKKNEEHRRLYPSLEGAAEGKKLQSKPKSTKIVSNPPSATDGGGSSSRSPVPSEKNPVVPSSHVPLGGAVQSGRAATPPQVTPERNETFSFDPLRSIKPLGEPNGVPQMSRADRRDSDATIIVHPSSGDATADDEGAFEDSHDELTPPSVEFTLPPMRNEVLPEFNLDPAPKRADEVGESSGDESLSSGSSVRSQHSKKSRASRRSSSSSSSSSSSGGGSRRQSLQARILTDGGADRSSPLLPSQILPSQKSLIEVDESSLPPVDQTVQRFESAIRQSQRDAGSVGVDRLLENFTGVDPNSLPPPPASLWVEGQQQEQVDSGLEVDPQVVTRDNRTPRGRLGSAALLHQRVEPESVVPVEAGVLQQQQPPLEVFTGVANSLPLPSQQPAASPPSTTSWDLISSGSEQTSGKKKLGTPSSRSDAPSVPPVVGERQGGDSSSPLFPSSSTSWHQMPDNDTLTTLGREAVQQSNASTSAAVGGQQNTQVGAAVATPSTTSSSPLVVGGSFAAASPTSTRSSPVMRPEASVVFVPLSAAIKTTLRGYLNSSTREDLPALLQQQDVSLLEKMLKNKITEGDFKPMVGSSFDKLMLPLAPYLKGCLELISSETVGQETARQNAKKICQTMQGIIVAKASRGKIQFLTLWLEICDYSWGSVPLQLAGIAYMSKPQKNLEDSDRERIKERYISRLKWTIQQKLVAENTAGQVVEYSKIVCDITRVTYGQFITINPLIGSKLTQTEYDQMMRDLEPLLLASS